MGKRIILFSIFIGLLIGHFSFASRNGSDMIHISVMGDVMLDRGIGKQIDIHGPDYPWENVKDVLIKSDLSFVNLETSIGKTENAEIEKMYVFQSKPETLKGLVNAGIDGVSLANNHTLDYGREGFLETLNYLDEMNIRYSGGGRNLEEALKPAVWEKRGVRVGFLAFSRVIPNMSWYAADDRPGIASGYDYYSDRASKLVEEVKKQVDFVIVSVHWGKELEEFPQEKDTKFAKLLIDSGADLIIGHHPHVLQGIEFYKNRPIVYSLGNFVFNSRGIKSNTTMIVNISITHEGIASMNIIPVVIKNGQPNIAEGADKEEIILRMNQLSKQWDTYFTNEGEIQGPIHYISVDKTEMDFNPEPEIGKEQQETDRSRNQYKKPFMVRAVTNMFRYEDTNKSNQGLYILKKKNRVVQFDYQNSILTIDHTSKEKTGFLEVLFIEAPIKMACKILKWKVKFLYTT